MNEQELLEIARARADFVKRLFAVTLSVGIASQLSHLFMDPASGIFVNHVLSYGPLAKQWKSLFLLLVSLFIVVSSWEGYHGAITRLPLKDAGRFWIDILLVFTYLVLELASNAYGVWFIVHLVIFIEYLIWDILRCRLPDYKPRDRSYKLSMTITMVWLVYFAAILFFQRSYHVFDEGPGFIVITLAAWLGVHLYREDKSRQWPWLCKALAFAPLLFLFMVTLL